MLRLMRMLSVRRLLILLRVVHDETSQESRLGVSLTSLPSSRVVVRLPRWLGAYPAVARESVKACRGEGRYWPTAGQDGGRVAEWERDLSLVVMKPGC